MNGTEEITSETNGNQDAAPNLEQQSDSLAAGFNRVRGIEETPHTPEATQQELRQVDDQPAEEPAPEQILEPSEVAALREQLERDLSKVHGKIGEINKHVIGLQRQTGADNEQRKVALGKLRDDYPELADSIEPLLSGGGISQEQITQMVNEQLAAERDQLTKAIAQAKLTAKHPDWEEVKASREFNEWFNAKPEDERQAVSSTWDSGAVSKLFTDFKGHQAAIQAQERSKQAKLAGAATPRGAPSTAARQSRVPDSAGLAAGFNRVRRLA